MFLPVPYLEGRVAVRVVLVFAAAYVLSYAFRAINAVIAPALMADLHLSNSDLGLLTSAYFVGFAGLQLPLGVWLDKYGARRTEASLLLFAAIGSALFATSTSLTGLWIGRAMIGVGVSACLMAPLKAYRVWYRPEQQSQLGSWMLVFGTCGALATTIPVALLLPIIGWRSLFWIMAGLIMLAAMLVFFKLKDVERDIDAQQAQAAQASAPASTGGPSSNESYLAIFSNPYFQRMAMLGAIHQGGFLAMQTLWAGPWMIRVLGLTATETSQVLFAFNFALLLSYLILSWWSPRHISFTDKPGLPALKVVSVGLGGAVLVQVLIVLFTAKWAWLLWILFAILVTVTTIAQMHVSVSFPPHLAGRANSAFNLMLFIGAFSIQWGVGLVIDLFVAQGWPVASSMRIAWSIYLVIQTIALLLFIKHPAANLHHRPATS